MSQFKPQQKRVVFVTYSCSMGVNPACEAGSNNSAFLCDSREGVIHLIQTELQDSLSSPL